MSSPTTTPAKAVPEPSPVKKAESKKANDAVLAAIQAAVDAVAVGYQWEQTPESLTLVFSVPKATQLVDVRVSISATEIKAGVEGKPLRIAGTLHQEIDPEASTWQLESKKETQGSRTFVQIILEKKVPLEWQFPFKGPCADGTPLDGQGELELARYYESNRGFDRALEHLTRSAEQGHGISYVLLSKLYNLGEKSAYPVKVDQEKALDCARKAAELHNGEGMVLVGLAYQEGNGVPQSHKTAVEWYAKALVPEQQARDFTLAGSRQGPLQHLVTALFNLGIVHQSGKNDQPVDYSKALKYWTSAADLGFAPALYNLGVMFMNGQGVERDLGKAKELFEMAQKRNPNLKPPNLDAMVAAEAQRSTGATPGTPAAALPQVPRAAPPPATPPAEGSWLPWVVAVVAVGAAFFLNFKAKTNQ